MLFIVGTLLFLLAEYVLHKLEHTRNSECATFAVKNAELGFKKVWASLLATLALFFAVRTLTQLALSVLVLSSVVLQSEQTVQFLELKGLRVRFSLRENRLVHSRHACQTETCFALGRTSVFWDWVFNTRHPSCAKLTFLEAALSALPGLCSFELNTSYLKVNAH